MCSLQKRIAEKINRKDGRKRDLSQIYGDRELMEQIIDEITAPYVGKVDYVASPESMGFILGSMVAAKLGVGFIPIRNKDLYALNPEDSLSAPYIDHRNRPRALQVRNDVVRAGSRILLVDDWVQTAATIHACESIVEDAEAKVAGIAAVGADYNDKTRGMQETGQLKCAVVHEV